ncbi:hypothetical protein EDD11_008200 [Mortierella claussenii]|nr:hypothetical protein EDD11_008200 [Mortierella claussenii]
MSVPPEHLNWVFENASSWEHVLFANFVRRFDLKDRKIKKAFETFQLHRQDMFWAKRDLKLKTAVSALEAGVIAHDMRIKQAKISSAQHFSQYESEPELMGKSEGDIGDEEDEIQENGMYS